MYRIFGFQSTTSTTISCELLSGTGSSVGRPRGQRVAVKPGRRWSECDSRDGSRIALHRHFLRAKQVVVFAEVDGDALSRAARPTSNSAVTGDPDERAPRRRRANHFDIAFQARRVRCRSRIPARPRDLRFASVVREVVGAIVVARSGVVCAVADHDDAGDMASPPIRARPDREPTSRFVSSPLPESSLAFCTRSAVAENL